MNLIDSNALIVLILGLKDTKLIPKHKRTSIYYEQDFYDLQAVIEDIRNLVVLPNNWTEVNNLLNNFKGDYKQEYIYKITDTIKNSTEKYIPSNFAVENFAFIELGITDTLILECAKECKLIITSDSKLSDYANALGFKVFDLVKNRNDRF